MTFCSQCFGRGYVRIEGKQVTCTCLFLKRHPSTQNRECSCGFIAESWAVWDWHQRVDHTEVIYSPYRDDTDHWSIEMHRDGESLGRLAFSTEQGWREACKELGLGDPVAEAEFEAKQEHG